MPYADPEIRKARRRDWHAENIEARALYAKEWRDKNKEKLNAEKREYYAEHREELLAGYKKKYIKNREQILTYQAGYRAANKEKVNAQGRKYRAEHPLTKEQRREITLKNFYGITVEFWSKMFLEQDSCCAICKRPDPGSKVGWHTDHCHKTKKVRGIVCHGCNLALGGAKDNPNTLRAAADYLEKGD